MRTTQSEIAVAMAAGPGSTWTATRWPSDGGCSTVIRTRSARSSSSSSRPGIAVTVEKIVAVATSRDPAISTPALAVAVVGRSAGRFADLLADHERAWADLWRSFGVTVQAGERAGTALKLHTFHVLQTVAGGRGRRRRAARARSAR